MKKRIIKATSFLFSILLIFFNFFIGIGAEQSASYTDLQLDCKSAILMEAETGKILYANNENEALPPASVTKVMTLLLVMEAIEENKLKIDDILTASEHACSMGGSQIFLEPGEKMTVEDLLKSVVIASANDAAVTLAEHIAGTEEAFVELMNNRAKELGMENSNFENTNGLDDTTTNHVTSAKDIAIMSRELIKFPKITEYSSIWMDTIRNGEFGLSNTNRLIRFYKGATGLKTGSTAKAGFCITATAERDGMTLIAVIMGAPSRDIRNSAATSLLNYGFSNFTVFRNSSGAYKINVVKGKQNICSVEEQGVVAVIEKKYINKIKKTIELDDTFMAPITFGQHVGNVTYSVDNNVICTAEILSVETVKTVGFTDILLKIFAKITLK